MTVHVAISRLGQYIKTRNEWMGYDVGYILQRRSRTMNGVENRRQRSWERGQVWVHRRDLNQTESGRVWCCEFMDGLSDTKAVLYLTGIMA